MVIGNLGRDPEMRYTPQGIPVTSFSVATNRFFNDAAGERQQETQWFTVIAWRQLAEHCNQYLQKGRRAFIEGSLRSRTWEGTDGQSHFVNEIVANRVLFLDRADREGLSGTNDQPSDPSGDTEVPDDLPF
tara:strand:+ start:136 stop:528 length:393 start_codon:yes stop_codon:yes gene_type:complete